LTEGTVTPSTLTFTPNNWNAPQAVLVTGVDDFIIDGTQAYQIITGAANSADPTYDGLNPPDVSVSNTDNETAGATVHPTSGLITSEDGTITATFSVVLNAQPAADVTIGISSSNTNEGTASPGGLTFTSL